MENKKNILIVGNSSAVSFFVKKIKDCCQKIYVNSRFFDLPQNVEFIDIRDNNISEMLKFAIEEDINLTVVFSEKALAEDIGGVFSANGQLIFAPEYNSAKHFIDKAVLKKLLYKLGIKIPKFGVFDKSQTALDYINTTQLPVIISSAFPESEKDIYACPTVQIGNIAINDLFFRNEGKILVEEYLSGHNFTTYIITDNVSAIPIGTLATGKFSDDVEGGFLTKGAFACLPDIKVTQDIENYIVYEVWEKISAYFEKGGDTFVGIVGINGVIKNDEIYITDITPTINPTDAPVLINSIDENLIALFEACTIGSFTDDYDFIRTNDYAYISLALFSSSTEKIINWQRTLSEPENLDLNVKIFDNKCFSHKGFIGTLWESGRTLASAKRKLAENSDNLSFNGIKFRKDVITLKDI